MTHPFYGLGCELCNAAGCRYCDPLGNDRAAHAQYLADLRAAGPDRQRELREAGDYYQAHRWVDAAGGWVY